MAPPVMEPPATLVALTEMAAADGDGPIMEMTDPAVVRVILAPAVIVIVPVLLAKAFAATAFKPLTETVILLAAVAVWRLTLAPAAIASERAFPAMLVPEAEIVLVGAAPGAATLS